MDTADLSEIVEIHGKAIYSFCYNLARNKNDADDLYQEAFLKATELCWKIDKKNNPKGFIISVAVGIWKNNRRKYAWRQNIVKIEAFNDDLINNPALQEENTPEDIFITNEIRAAVQEAAKQLNDRLRIPLYMHYTAGMSIEEIAKALKIPKGTVKSRLYKARVALKNNLEVNAYER